MVVIVIMAIPRRGSQQGIGLVYLTIVTEHDASKRCDRHTTGPAVLGISWLESVGALSDDPNRNSMKADRRS